MSLGGDTLGEDWLVVSAKCGEEGCEGNDDTSEQVFIHSSLVGVEGVSQSQDDVEAHEEVQSEGEELSQAQDVEVALLQVSHGFLWGHPSKKCLAEKLVKPKVADEICSSNVSNDGLPSANGFSNTHVEDKLVWM